MNNSVYFLRLAKRSTVCWRTLVPALLFSYPCSKKLACTATYVSNSTRHSAHGHNLVQCHIFRFCLCNRSFPKNLVFISGEDAALLQNSHCFFASGSIRRWVRPNFFSLSPLVHNLSTLISLFEVFCIKIPSCWSISYQTFLNRKEASWTWHK